MDEVLLVTGSSGIAAAVARMWAAEDPVFVFGVNENECHSLADELHNVGCAVGDVRDEAAVRRGIADCLDRFGRIDALMNVAGISARSLGDGQLHQCTSEAWDAVMDVNAKGTFLMCREVLGLWTKNGQGGVILNTGSVLARHPQREHFSTAAYAASKGAIEAMTVAAAAYYAPEGIRINVIAPGLVLTPMTTRALASTEIMKYMIHKQPLRKGMLTTEDIARAACFLLRKDSSPITGQILTVDAGWAVSE
ncbi:MAG TPA: SDR family oxidoreductase [Verrucomicrobiae bacterium]|nr:SDR family oxidoreductase [Verrucomicrobiae bacterium]